MPSCTPMPHQREAILEIERRQGRCLIADDMGLGKSVTALGTLYRNPEWLPAVIICPAAVKYHWESEAIRHFGLRASVCEGESAPPPSEMDKAPAITVINSDILAPNKRAGKKTKARPWIDYLIKLKPQTLIIDECQMLANRWSKRTRQIQKLAKKVPHILPMSGTPVMNSPVELFPIVSMLWPKEFGDWWTYAKRYCDPKLLPWGWQYSGATNLDELHARLQKLGLIRRTESILSLPERTTEIKLVKMKDPAQYEKAQLDFLGWVREKKPGKLRKVRRAEAVSKVGYLLRLAAQLKMRACVDWANDFLENNPGEKLVLFGYHTPVIKFLMQEVRAKSIAIDGSVTGRQREELIWQFQHDPQTRFCAAQLKAGGVGISLTAARTLGIVELWHNPAILKQAIKRVHRIGQTKPVNILYLVAEGSIEVKLCKLLEKKSKVANAIVDGDSEAEAWNLYEELLSELKGGLKI